ncbi:MAG: hypothetical protein ACO25K_06380 [Candidatus Fonsibacter ubiquis]
MEQFIEKLKQLDPFYEYSDSFSDGGRWRRQSQLHEELMQEAKACPEKQALLDKHMGRV